MQTSHCNETGRRDPGVGLWVWGLGPKLRFRVSGFASYMRTRTLKERQSCRDMGAFDGRSRRFRCMVVSKIMVLDSL